jgi:hypothetical protein
MGGSEVRGPGVRAREARIVHEIDRCPARGRLRSVESDRSAAGGDIWQRSGPATENGGADRLRSPARAAEGDAAFAERDEGVVADHEVVEQLDIEQAAGRQRLGGQVQVVR